MKEYESWVELASDLKSPIDIPATIGNPEKGWICSASSPWSNARNYFDGEQVAQIALKFSDAISGDNEPLKIKWKAYLLKITKNAVDAKGKR